jgi:ketosteroid isomerase-like protein
MPHPNEELVTRFYSAFAARDADAMAACYAPDVRFSDPVFPELVGDRARGMWRMLLHRGKDLRVEFSGVRADDREGSAHWEAWYTFSATGRKVHNVIDARFTFKDGLVATHTDSFDFYRWSKQALGPTGLLLGWTPLVRNKVRATAGKGLDDFLARR